MFGDRQAENIGTHVFNPGYCIFFISEMVTNQYPHDYCFSVTNFIENLTNLILCLCTITVVAVLGLFLMIVTQKNTVQHVIIK